MLPLLYPLQTPAKQCQADLFFSTPPLCHLLIIPEKARPSPLAPSHLGPTLFAASDSPTFLPVFLFRCLALPSSCACVCLTAIPDREECVCMFVRVCVLSNNSQSLISMSKPLCLPSEQSAQRLVAFCPPILPAPQKEQRGGRSEGLCVCVFVCVCVGG